MRAFFIYIFMVCSTISFPAQAQVLEVIGVDRAIQSIRNGLSEIISQAETSASVVAFGVAADSNYLLQNFESVAANLIDKSASQMNTSQRNFLERVYYIAVEADRSSEDFSQMLSETVSQTGAELSRIPGVSNRPFVYRSSPNFFINDDAGVYVTFIGSLLNGENSLRFGAVTCETAGFTENSLRFWCPQSVFEGEEVSRFNGSLELKRPNRFFNWNNSVYNYDIQVNSIPRILGNYTMHISERRLVNDPVPRDQSNTHRNNHCSGARNVAWSYRPADKCVVDVRSVGFRNRNVSSNSSLEGIINLSSSGFQVRGVVRNNGICGPFGVPRDARGSISVHLTWNDICERADESELEPVSGDIFWGEHISFTLPKDYTKFILTVRQANGEVIVINETASTPWFQTTFDPAQKTLILRPRSIEEAFR